jgi:vanillate O-demethylase ferredoxin subunit
MVRQYSLIDFGTHNENYFICVQHEETGRGGSRAVHQQLSTGDILHISVPRNTFALRDVHEPTLLLAGGIGLTPLISMAQELHRAGTSFELHTYSRNASSLPLHDKLAALPFAQSLTHHFSDQGDSFRTSHPAALTNPAGPAQTIYICGPQQFIDLARSRAVEAGWEPAKNMSEQFTAAPTKTLAGEAFTVIAASTGQSMEVGPEESIADVLERNGYETYRSCGEGYCGSCITRVISGTPEHRDIAQSDAEHAANTHINICCSRSHTPTLEIDI